MSLDNILYCGDCLDWLNKLPDSSIDVCYIDPPFFSNRNYEIIWGNSYERRSFGDRFAGGITHYTDWMLERIRLIYEKLSPMGALYLHCDYHASHYLKVACDDVFGTNDNFRNEIMWCYTSPSNVVRHFPRKHDSILYYVKNKQAPFYKDKVRVPYKEETFTLGSSKSLARTNKEASPYEGTQEYLARGKVVEDFWTDIRPLSVSNEAIGYKTQKPEALVRRILLASSREGDTVLDCFGGGGTTAKVAAELSRRFISGDVSPVAVRVMAKRLNAFVPGTSYHVEGIPYTKEELCALDGHAFADLVCRCKGWDVEEKKSNDKGMDGWADKKQVPIQIKNHKAGVGRLDLQRFAGAMQGKKEGVFVAWDFTPTAIEYIAELKKSEGKKITAVRVEKDIFEELIISQDKEAKLKRYYKARANKQRSMLVDAGIEIIG